MVSPPVAECSVSLVSSVGVSFLQPRRDGEKGERGEEGKGGGREGKRERGEEGERGGGREGKKERGEGRLQEPGYWVTSLPLTCSLSS